jgi:hypothetical protein
MATLTVNRPATLGQLAMQAAAAKATYDRAVAAFRVTLTGTGPLDAVQLALFDAAQVAQERYSAL